MAGVVVALALIPEAIAFSIIAGEDPKVGLYASFSIVVVTAFVGGRPGMISAATGAMALLMIVLVRDHGLEYLFAATILTGILQILSGWLKLGRYIKFVPKSVMVGFVNPQAILIFLAQLPLFVGTGWMMYAIVGAGLAVIYLLPRVTNAVPSPLVAILLLTVVSLFLPEGLSRVGDMGALPSTLPFFSLPSVPFSMDTLRIIFPVSIALAMVGLIESLLTASIVDKMTHTLSDKNRESTGQGIANIVTGFFGGPLPAVFHSGAGRLAGAHSHGGACGRRVHGLDRHFRLGVTEHHSDHAAERNTGDGCDRRNRCVHT